jgi:hypothetical protein
MLIKQILQEILHEMRFSSHKGRPTSDFEIVMSKNYFDDYVGFVGNSSRLDYSTGCKFMGYEIRVDEDLICGAYIQEK